MDTFWIAIITPVATVICNAVYIAFVKNQIDKKIELLKISYSGVFKEKIDYAKEMLIRLRDLKNSVDRFCNMGEASGIGIGQITSEINSFIDFNVTASLFFDNEVVKSLDEIVNSLQKPVDLAIREFSKDKVISAPYWEDKPEGVDDYDFEYYIEVSNLLNGRSYYTLRQRIINSVRMDLGLDLQIEA